MRLFLGIKIPESTQKVFIKKLEALKKEYGQASWTPIENYHITLQFLDDMSEYESLIPALETVAFENKPFELTTLSGGVFIDDRLTLYIDFYRDRAIQELVKGIRFHLGIHDKYRFIPHVTVAKMKTPSKQQYYLIKKKFENLEFQHNMKVTEMILYQSVITSKQPQYIELKKFTLGE